MANSVLPTATTASPWRGVGMGGSSDHFSVVRLNLAKALVVSQLEGEYLEPHLAAQADVLGQVDGGHSPARDQLL